MVVKRLLILLSLFSLGTLNIYALESTSSASLLTPDQTEEIAQKPMVGAFKVSGNYLWSTKADFKEDGFEDQHSTFEQGVLDLSYIVKSPKRNGIFYGLGYTHTRLKWEQNPSFSKDNFSYLSAGVGGFNSSAVENWVFEGGAQVLLNTNHWSIKDYSLAFFVAKGRYAFRPNMGLHVGALGQFGLQKNQFFPVLGIDYKVNQWAFFCIFPRKVAGEYTFNENWKFALEGKVFRARYRVGKDETESKAIFEYRSAGFGLAATYMIKDRLSADLFTGYKTAGDLKIMNQYGQDADFYKFKGAWYYGGKVSYSF